MELEKLVEAVKATGNDGAVMYKLNDGKVTHISPLVQVQSVQELYDQLSSVETAIHSFLNDLINKGLCKN